MPSKPQDPRIQVAAFAVVRAKLNGLDTLSAEDLNLITAVSKDLVPFFGECALISEYRARWRANTLREKKTVALATG